MPRAELGKGGGGKDYINVFDVTNCQRDCPLREGGWFKCQKHNGNATVVVTGGMRRDTVQEFMRVAPCFAVSSVI